MEEVSVDQAKAFIAELACENKEFYGSDRGRGALKDLQQTFPHTWIYVAELLQNAIDEGATSIHFDQPLPGVLLFEHNGKPFDKKDVEGICTKGVSSKGAGTVGFMGVGFKAVFRSFETVSISSGPWKIRLTAKLLRNPEFGDLQRDWIGTVLPQWDDSIPGPSREMTCRFELDNRLQDLNEIEADFETVFRADNALMALLATRGVREVKRFGATWLLSEEEYEQQSISARCLIQAIHDGSENIQQWMLFRKEYEPSKEAVRRFLEHRAINPKPEEKEMVYKEAARERRVEIFFALDDEGFPKLGENGEAFALLPTRQKLPFGVHVNADWLLTVTRNEFMELEDSDQRHGNAWQKEIRSVIPDLIAAYLEWLGSDDGPAVGEWETAYNVFPDEMSPEYPFGRWLLSSDFLLHLKWVLTSIAFLPALPDPTGNFDFLSPDEARFLPSELSNAIEEESFLHPKKLFGEKIVWRTTLGERASRFLLDQRIIREISTDELESYWETTKVGEWYKHLPAATQDENLYSLIVALSKIQKPLWYNEDLVCLPTQTDDWVSKSQGIRLPADWDIVVNEERIPDMLLPFVGDGNRIISRKFELFVRNKHYTRWIPGFLVEQSSLDDIVDAWWQSMPEKALSALQIEDIIKFTCWVQEKQTSRHSLVKKLLIKRADGKLALRKVEDALLADPYAGDFRRLFFQDILPVTERYYQNSSKDADWRGFFDRMSPKPKGRFQLDPVARSINRDEIKKIYNQTPPSTRVTYHCESWHGDPRVEVCNDDYVLVEFSLPDDVVGMLSRCEQVSNLTAFSLWLAENPGPLREFTHRRLLYIPHGTSYISEIELEQAAQWVIQLIEIPWIMAKDGTGPYKPSDVLKKSDPSRPSAPIADLPAELIRIIEQAGVSFELWVPEAESIRRLQVEGPNAGIERVLELFKEAVADAEDDHEKGQELSRVLAKAEVFPIPLGSQPLDGKMRVPGKRCVLRAGPGYRSDLSWVVPVERFEEGSVESQIISLAKGFIKFPEQTTSCQCTDFLEWVWEKLPDADSVRHLLPRAYGYVKHDLSSGIADVERWNALRSKAQVYTLGRRWVPLYGKDPVYFDDIGVERFTDLVPRKNLATPGHMGLKTEHGQSYEGVDLLGIPRTSSLYRIKQAEGKQLKTPDSWSERFQQVQELLEGIALSKDNLDDSTKHKVESAPTELFLRVVDELATVVIEKDSNSEIQRYPSSAEVSGNTVCVAGFPSDFAASLCRILIRHFHVDDADESILSTEIAVLIVLLDSNDFSKHIRSLRNRFGINPVEEGEEEIAAESDESSKKGGNEPHSTGKRTGGDEIEDGKGKPPPKGSTERDGSTEAPSSRSGSKSSPGGASARGSTGSHTSADRERKIAGLLKRLAELRAIGLVTDQTDESSSGDVQTDDKFRNAVVAYEKAQGRFPICKDSLQKGYDIDSFSDSPGTPGRQLIRRIEVKGRTHAWDGDEIVELSRAQYEEALEPLGDEKMDIDPEFDHWVYVVEELEEGRFNVLPTKNPARTAQKFELRGGTWRNFVEEEAQVKSEQVCFEPDDNVPKRRSIRDLPREPQEEMEEMQEKEDK